MINYSYSIVNPTKPTFLILHGWGVNSTYMNCISEIVKKSGYNSLLVDLPGHGKSPLLKPYTLSDYSCDLFQIVIKEKIDNLYGIGHSFGGKILLDYAIRFHINGLVLIAPSGYKNRYSISTNVKICLYKLLKCTRLYIPKWLRGSSDYQKVSGIKKKTFLNNCHAFFSKYQLKKIQSKVILVGFTSDKQVSVYSMKKLHQYLDNSRLFLYEGDHFEYFNKMKELRILINLLVRSSQ